MEKLYGDESDISIRFVDPNSSSDEWDRLIGEHPAAQFFHSAAWARVLTRTYSHKPFYLVATCGGRTIALIPVMEVLSQFTGARAVSLPFSDLCPPLLFDEASYQPPINALIDLGHARGWKSLELRGTSAISTTASPSYYAHTLNLERSEEELFQACDSGVRRAVRKAENNGLQVEIATSPEMTKEFYRLHCLTRRRHGLPPQPWKFFEHIQNEVISPGNGFVVTARRENLPVASAVFFNWKDKPLYKFGASDAASQKFRGNNVVIWEAIKFFVRRGAKSLHFGRTDCGHDGLRRFKLAWGVDEEPIHYRRFDFRRDCWRVTKPKPSGLFNQIFRLMPLPLNRLAGTLIYPHLD